MKSLDLWGTFKFCDLILVTANCRKTPTDHLEEVVEVLLELELLVLVSELLLLVMLEVLLLVLLSEELLVVVLLLVLVLLDLADNFNLSSRFRI